VKQRIIDPNEKCRLEGALLLRRKCPLCGAKAVQDRKDRWAHPEDDTKQPRVMCGGSR